ncbi:hypothetical protein PSHT_00570 [Puccinia striiformis]|uniref:Uncharacterized protein n=1 Tax=Puccinia striiformis TaxID=27350 RepID=A0A2S4WMZ8_9BASI|nr:hypothetical protein PSHT_00570 [Puccinia striiformis]
MTKKVTSGLQRQFKECYRESLKMITSKPIFRSQTMQESFQKRELRIGRISTKKDQKSARIVF